MRLRHIHLPSSFPAFPSYALASVIQESLRRQFLAAKDGRATAPPPTLLSFTPTPTYTVGRRQDAAALGPAEAARLRAPLFVPNLEQHLSTEKGLEYAEFRPKVFKSPRGGLTTYHGPGQVVLWPIFDLKSPHHRHFTVRSFSRALETTTIALLAGIGIPSFITNEPGIWTRATDGKNMDTGGGQEGEDLRKIAALGVHLRRNIAALGTALNLDMPVKRGGPQATADGDEDTDSREPGIYDESTNPWARFVPCGIENKGVTCVRAELERRPGAAGRPLGPWVSDSEQFAKQWAGLFAEELGLGRESVDFIGGVRAATLLSQVGELVAEVAGAEQLDIDYMLVDPEEAEDIKS